MNNVQTMQDQLLEIIDERVAALESAGHHEYNIAAIELHNFKNYIWAVMDQQAPAVEPAQAVPVGKDWDNFAAGFEAGWKECLDHCKPVYMYRRKGTFMPGQYVTCESKAQYVELSELKQFETDIFYDIPASDYTIYVDKLKPLHTAPLAISEPAQAVLVYEYRIKNVHFKNWSPWEECEKSEHDQYRANPKDADGWMHETRTLYTAPPAIDDETRESVIAFCEHVLDADIGGLLRDSAKDLLKILEAGK